MKRPIALCIAVMFFLAPVYAVAAEASKQEQKRESTPSRKEIQERVKHSPRYTVPRINMKGSYAQCK